DPRFFRSAPFSGATATAVTAFAAMGGFLFLNTLYLQDVRGFSPLAAGLYVLPMAVTMAVCAPLAGRIGAARRARIPLMVAGLAVMGSVLNGNLHGAMRTGFVPASQPGWWIVAACGAIILILGITTTGRWARRTAARTAARLEPADSATTSLLGLPLGADVPD